MNNSQGSRGVDCDWDTEELSDEEWMLFVAQGLAEELADPRDDIYDVNDGVTIHA